MDCLLDCHTHRTPPYSQGIINIEPGEPLIATQKYSAGIHPWHVQTDLARMVGDLECMADSPEVVAVGESGLDSVCATPMWLQVKAFVAQIHIAERLQKPLIVHCVRCVQEVVQLRRELRSTVPWIIHGFRGKPALLDMLLKADCYVSFGKFFNVESLKRVPESHILAETDESGCSIIGIIEKLSEARGEDLYPIIARNMSQIFVGN